MLNAIFTLLLSVVAGAIGWYSADELLDSTKSSAIGSMIGLAIFFITFFATERAADNMVAGRRATHMEKARKAGPSIADKLTQLSDIERMTDDNRSLASLARVVQRLLAIKSDSLPGVRQLLLSAGYLRDRAIFLFLIIKFATLVLGIATGLIYGMLTGGDTMTVLAGIFIGAGLGYYGPTLYVRERAKRRRRAISFELPDVIDLLVIYAESGYNFDASLARVIEVVGKRYPTIAGELRVLDYELRYFGDRTRAYENLTKRCSLDIIKRFSSIIMQSEELGTPIAKSLKILSTESRQDRFLDAERRAAKLPVLIQIPITLFILPSLFLFVLGPTAMRIMEAFASINR